MTGDSGDWAPAHTWPAPAAPPAPSWRHPVTQSACHTLIPSHITQTYHHNPVTRRQVAWQPFMSSPHRTSRDPNTQQQAAGGWTGWIQIASGVRPPCANALCEAGCTFYFIFRNTFFHPSTRLPCFWVGHQPVLSSEHSTMAYRHFCNYSLYTIEEMAMANMVC